MNIPWYFVPPFLPIDINLLNFINDLFSKFSRILNEPSSSTSSRPIIDSKKCINHFILMFLLGGTLALNELHIDSEEQWLLKTNFLLKVFLSLLFRILWALRNFSLIQYLSLVARLNYYLIRIVKYHFTTRERRRRTDRRQSNYINK